MSLPMMRANVVVAQQQMKIATTYSKAKPPDLHLAHTALVAAKAATERALLECVNANRESGNAESEKG